MAARAAAYGTMAVDFRDVPAGATRAFLCSTRADSNRSLYSMSDHDILFRWLATAAARMGWNRRMRELARLACAIFALCLLAEVLEIFGVRLNAQSVAAILLAVAA